MRRGLTKSHSALYSKLIPHFSAHRLRQVLLWSLRLEVFSDRQSNDRSRVARSAAHADVGRAVMAKLLLVEDNETNRDMLSRRLQRKGYAVVCAMDGQQAIELAAAENPALILMDMSLPVLDGWEATRRIKANMPTMPIIALTAHAMEGDERKSA
jgi:two-component system cell cycle response regulator DivK